MLQETISRIRNLFQEEPAPHEFGLVLTGGGARAAYQVGMLQYIADNFQDTRFTILIGVSAGAINAAHLADHPGTFRDAVQLLVENWRALRSADVYEVESTGSLLKTLVTRSIRLGNFDAGEASQLRAMANTAPLRDHLARHLRTEDGRLVGVEERLKAGKLRAAAIVGTNYTTGQTVSWVQGDSFERWERPNRVGINTTLTLDHIMASTSLPFLFPAVQIGDSWFGDGGIRLAAPLAPAIHLGADRILAISTRYSRTRAEADQPVVQGYPPASQIFGILTNAVFLDALEDDALILRRINHLVKQLPPEKRMGFRPINLLMLRPSVDLGKLAGDFRATLPGPLELFSKILGTDETKSPDWLSMLLFEYDYVARLMDIGYEDARHHHAQIEAFLSDVGPAE